MKRFLTFLCASLAAVFATAATLTPIQLLNPTGSTAGQVIVSNGGTSAPTWQSVPASGLAAQSANTVLGNGTPGAASPTALAVPSCSTSASALNWVSGTGFSCNTSVNASALGGATFAAPGAIGGTTPGSGAFTTLNTSGLATLNSLTTGSATVTGGTIDNAPIGATTANTGKFTTLQSTGAFTPSSTAGIVGTTTNNNANAGSIGEYITASTTNTSLTTGVAANLTSVSLTAGDWDVEGSAYFHPAGTTTITGLFNSISTTSATFGGLGSAVSYQTTFATGSNNYIVAPTVRISLASTTTVYVVGFANFGTSTMQGDGFIRARRVR